MNAASSALAATIASVVTIAYPAVPLAAVVVLVFGPVSQVISDGPWAATMITADARLEHHTSNKLVGCHIVVRYREANAGWFLQPMVVYRWLCTERAQAPG